MSDSEESDRQQPVAALPVSPNRDTPGATQQEDTEGAVPASAQSAEKKTDWLAELRGLALMLLAVLGFHSLIAKPFYIPSESMMPNLLVGDRLVVSKYPYGWNWSSVSFHLLPRAGSRLFGRTPEYGDIVIVVPRNRKQDLIKRVVALPGDRFAVVDGQIVINGKPVPQSVEPPLELPIDENSQCSPIVFPNAFTHKPSGKNVCAIHVMRETMPNGASYPIVVPQPTQWQENIQEIRVPAGHVYLMGDNRDNSADSRFPLEPDGQGGLGGPVPLSDIGGRAEFVTFSFDGGESWNPLSWWGALRGERAWSSLRPRIDKPGNQ